MALLKDSLITGDLRVTGTIYGLITNALKDGSGNTITSKYVTLDTAQTITGAKTITGNLTIGPGGGLLNGSATNGGCNTIRIGDDVWLGDVNVGGMMGMQPYSSGTTNCGFLFKNGAGTEIGRLYADSTNIVTNKAFVPATTNSINLGTSNLKWANVYATTFIGAINGINLKSYTGALNSGGWAIMNGKANSPSIAISYNNNAAAWNSATYSASLVYGCQDTRGLLDIGHSNRTVTFGGTSYALATDDAPGWYWKITGTSTKTYTLPADTSTLVPTTGAGATGTWGISVSGNAATSTTSNNGLFSAQAYPLGKSDKPYHHVATFTQNVASSQINTKLVLLVTNYYATETRGILEISCRWEGGTTTVGWMRVNWLVASNIDKNNFIGTWKYDADTATVTLKLYAKLTGWTSLNFVRLQEHNWGSWEKKWVLNKAEYNSGASYCLASIPSDENQITSSFTDINNNAASATKLATARTINGTNFDGTANITTANWGTARTITIGSTGKSVNGSANVSWSLAEIGAAAASHTHSYLPLSGGTMTGRLSICSQTIDPGVAPNVATIEVREVQRLTSNTTLPHTAQNAPRIGFHWGSRYWGQIALFDSAFRFYNNALDGYMPIYGSQVYGAVWNDYAEFRKTAEAQPGQCVREVGNGSLVLTTKRLEKGCEIVSDTYGFAIGETDECKTPIATTGRVLAYPYEDIEEFKNHIGDPVCSGPNGTVSIMTEEEEEKYPSRIIGTISEIPTYETWGTGNVKVNKRVWIRIR